MQRKEMYEILGVIRSRSACINVVRAKRDKSIGPFFSSERMSQRVIQQKSEGERYVCTYIFQEKTHMNENFGHDDVARRVCGKLEILFTFVFILPIFEAWFVRERGTR